MKLEEYIESRETQPAYKKVLVIIGILLLLWVSFSFYRKVSIKHRVFMSIEKVTPEKAISIKEENKYSFKLGDDFFVYYKKGWSTPESITVKVYKLVDSNRGEMLYNTSRKFKKDSNRIQLYFDDTFFELPGEYEIEFLDEEGELLTKKIFELKG